ncbi:MAG: hypothetical protein WDN25_03860 [Acetobacteraceae bacterium]
MPARTVIVLDDRACAEAAASALQVIGIEAAYIHDPMAALDALDGAQRIEVLATSIDHGRGKPNGIALALMARMKRPGIKVVFVGQADMAHHTTGLGAFLVSPVPATEVVDAVVRMLAEGYGPPADPQPDATARN